VLSGDDGSDAHGVASEVDGEEREGRGDDAVAHPGEDRRPAKSPPVLLGPARRHGRTVGDATLELVKLVPRPPVGRVYETTKYIRVADTAMSGRLRLDAVARYVQDVGPDDVADAGHPPSNWVVRRSTVVADTWPRLHDHLAVATWCGATGNRWAERRVSFIGEHGTVDVGTLVIHLDATGRPAPLPAWFHETYVEAAMGRTLRSRLALPSPPDDAERSTWQLRATDLDVNGHVNNARTWEVVEDLCARFDLVPRVATMEWINSIDPGDDVTLLVAPRAGGFGAWLEVGGTVRVAADVEG
jgi:acyl-ACP thioesterase